MTNDNQYLSVTQAAAALGISRQRVLVLVAEGRLPAVKVGSYWMIQANDLAEFMISRMPDANLSPSDYKISFLQED